jgi:DNA (cytosine-5)-methyltransferase 1
MKIADFFCWCGWLSLWFKLAWFDVALWLDNDKSSLETYQKNFPKAKAVNYDLFDEKNLKKIAKELKELKIDGIVWWPPCQGFSLTWARNFNDSRNKLYKAMFDVIKYAKPKFFVIENVPWMASMYNGEVKEEIIKKFQDIWYEVSSQILHAADYGVPQTRKRLFFVGLKKWIWKNFKFPLPLYDKTCYVSCEEAIWDLPSREDWIGKEFDKYIKKPSSEYQKLMRKDSDSLYNHVGTEHKPHVINVIKHVPNWWNHKDLPKWIWDSRKFNEARTRYHSQKPSKTIDTWHRNHFHYKYNRIPTVRENARLQSFPDNFVFEWTKTQQYRQVGNAVPPLLAQIVAKQIKKHL